MNACGSFSCNEIDFLAEDQEITIIPHFKVDILHFISGNYGPFIPGKPVTVPFWLALTLKKRQKCKVKPPEWLCLDVLNEKYEEEKSNESRFSELPQHYLELSTLLVSNCADNIRNPEEIRQKIEDIWELRHSKIRKGLHELKDSTPIKLNNLTLMELNTVRPFFVEAMN
eukprot:Sdes_comp20093_c0_seq1m13050